MSTPPRTTASSFTIPKHQENLKKKRGTARGNNTLRVTQTLWEAGEQPPAASVRLPSTGYEQPAGAGIPAGVFNVKSANNYLAKLGIPPVKGFPAFGATLPKQRKSRKARKNRRSTRKNRR